MIEKLYEKYHQELVKWCQGMTDSFQTAEELVQEAFLRAMLFEELLTMLDEGQRRSWLYRTVKNMYIDRIRHFSRETITEILPEKQKEPEELREAEWKDLLDSLPDIEGMLFSMRYLEGYNSRQIGEMLSLPPGTVRSKLSSARKHLKDVIGGK
ncbi:MAG: RNA polymerase sigma factor [Suilimivivens sp.]